MTIVGEHAAAGGGYVYRIVMRLRESGGVNAAITGVDLTFMNGAAVLMTAHHAQLIPSNANVCPASGTVDTRELVTSDTGASRPYATRVQATVSYTDASGVEWTATGSADVPPLADQPPTTYTLTGTIVDQATHVGIGGARIEVLNGANAGAAAIADASGAYTLTNLAAGTFRLRTSASDYGAGEQNVTVPDMPRADFELRRSSALPCVYSITPAGDLAVSFVAGQFTLTITRASGTCGWQVSTDAVWLEPRSASGDGTTAITINSRSNASFVGRVGTISVDWNGGRVQLVVRQAGESPAFCRIVTVTVGGQSAIDVGSAGGQFTASIMPEPGTPPGVCGAWTATASTGITFVGASSGPSAPGNVTFAVSANPAPAARTMTVTVAFAGGPSAALTIRQVGQ